MTISIEISKPTVWTNRRTAENPNGITKILYAGGGKWNKASASVNVVQRTNSQPIIAVRVDVYDWVNVTSDLAQNKTPAPLVYDGEQFTSDTVSSSVPFFESRVVYQRHGDDSPPYEEKHAGPHTFHFYNNMNIRVWITQCSRNHGGKIFCVGVTDSTGYFAHSPPICIGSKSRKKKSSSVGHAASDDAVVTGGRANRAWTFPGSKTASDMSDEDSEIKRVSTGKYATAENKQFQSLRDEVADLSDKVDKLIRLQTWRNGPSIQESSIHENRMRLPSFDLGLDNIGDNTDGGIGLDTDGTFGFPVDEPFFL